jgi:hypothetical protein
MQKWFLCKGQLLEGWGGPTPPHFKRVFLGNDLECGTGVYAAFEVCAMPLQELAHRRHISAHRIIISSLPPIFSHISAQFMHISAQVMHIFPLIGEQRIMQLIVAWHMSAQS